MPILILLNSLGMGGGGQVTATSNAASGGGGGIRHSIYGYYRGKKSPETEEDFDWIFKKTMEEIYRDLIERTAPKKAKKIAEKIAAPFVDEKDDVDLLLLERDAKKVAALLKLWAETFLQDALDEEDILLMGA
jgi:hypothetical protein